MKRFNRAVILCAAMGALLAGMAWAGPAARGNKNAARPLYVPGEVIVTFREGVTDRDAEGSIRSGNHSAIRGLGRGMYHLRIRDAETVEDALAAYKGDPSVEHAQPNYYHYALMTPNDPAYLSGDLWWITNTGQTIPNVDYTMNNPGTAGMDMNLLSAWDLWTDCSSVTVAVVDSGINYNHEDITGNMWNGTACVDQYGAAIPGGCPNGGWNYISNNNNPMDDNGHGTHVAGIIGASGNNGLGGSGVCQKSRLMAVKALDSTGSGTSITIMNAINFAVKNGARIINMSVGGYQFDQLEYNAISAARTSGVLVVVAAGNDGYDLGLTGQTTYPCQYNLDNIACIAALDQKYQLATFSNWGAGYVHAGAPGVNIRSTFYASVTVFKDNFTSGWIGESAGGWMGTTCDLGGGAEYIMVNPDTWCSWGQYSNSVNQTVYKNFALSGFNKIVLSYYAYIDTEPGKDYFSVYYKTGGGDPSSGGTLVGSLSGISDNYFYLKEYDISGCNTAACTVGFNLTTNATNRYYGIGIIDFRIDGITTSISGYAVENGTSMATPAATGTAAMVWAYNPSFTYMDVKNAVISGGDAVASLSGKSVTGKAVDARGALIYINAPTGVTAVVQ